MPSVIITRPDWAEHTHWVALVEPDCSVVLPVGHGAHVAVPSVAPYVPITQAEQPVPSTCMPFLHTHPWPSPRDTLFGSDRHRQSLLLTVPTSLVTVPVGHGLQDNKPTASPYLPMPHLSQLSPPDDIM